jgi:hypothetical protein
MIGSRVPQLLWQNSRIAEACDPVEVSRALVKATVSMESIDRTENVRSAKSWRQKEEDE